MDFRFPYNNNILGQKFLDRGRLYRNSISTSSSLNAATRFVGEKKRERERKRESTLRKFPCNLSFSGMGGHLTHFSAAARVYQKSSPRIRHPRDYGRGLGTKKETSRSRKAHTDTH